MVIYKATNRINGKIYIGYTTGPFEKRKAKHISVSKYPGSPGFSAVHAAMRKYGIENFDWEVIDTGNTKEDLGRKEEHWVAFYESNNKEKGYNLTPGGIINKISKSSRKRIGKAKSIPIYCHQNGKVYPSATKAGKELGIDNSLITAVIKGRKDHAHGYTFECLDPNKVYPLILKPMIEIDTSKYAQRIYCFQNGRIYRTIKDAAKALKIEESNIREFFKGRLNSVKGYTFEKVENENEYPLLLEDKVKPHMSNKIKILCHQNGKIYNGVREAAKELHLNHPNISRVLKGKQEATGNYTFEYYKESSIAS